MEISGSVVAITGGARGIGLATAHAFARAGARVAIGDRDGEGAQRAAPAVGAGAIAATLDVTDRGSFAAFLDRVEDELGPLGVLVNNAGIMVLSPFEQESDAAALAQVNVNLLGVIHGSREAVARMRPRGRGRLVNVASMAGKIGTPGGATYAATKHGVVGLSESLRLELRGSGVGVSVVMPAVVRTQLAAGIQESRVASIEPEEVAAAIVAAVRDERFDVFVPRSVGVIHRLTLPLPRRLVDAIGRALKADRVLTDAAGSPARVAYEQRSTAANEAVHR